MRPPVRSIARSLAPVLAVGILLAGCTAAGATGEPPDLATASPTAAASPSAGPSSQPGKYELSSDPDALVLRVDTSGGLVAPGYFLTHVPELSVYGDGRLIVPGAVDASYPGPLLPNLEVSTLTPADLQRLMAAADEAGLLGPDVTYEMGGVADAGTTVFTATVAGKTHRVSAYALGIGNESTTDPATSAARARLQAFRAGLFDLSTLLGHPVQKAAYVATAARVFVGEPAQVQPPMTQQELTWPLAVNPSTGKGTTNPGLQCLAVSGADLTTFLATARTANALAVWKAPSGRYSIQVRLLLPGESGCA